MMALMREPSAESCVDQRRGLVDTTPDPGDDAIDDLHQVVVVLDRETNGRLRA
jgi:hypothetical protein